MSKFVVTIFNDEKTAYEGSKAMLDLHQDGSIVLFAGAVISKDADGNASIKEAADEGPVGTATGLIAGSLIGLLGGAAGLAAGASAGTAIAAAVAGKSGGFLAGVYSDLYDLGVDGQFLSDIADLMEAGNSAVVAEIAEGWTTPLDAKMEELGGTVHRRYRIDVEDEQIQREIEATNRELDELEDEWNQATGEAKAKLKAKVDAAREKLNSLSEKATSKMTSLKEEAEAKIQKLNDQIANASEEVKEKFEKERDKLKADYVARSEKLSQAAKLTREALT